MKMIYINTKISSNRILIALLCGLITFYTCFCGNRIERETGSIETVGYKRSNEQIPYIKLHSQNGNVYVLNNWSVDTDNKFVSGKGKNLDANRELIKEGDFEIPFSNIVLAETNLIHGESGIAPLAVITVIMGIIAVVCITNPKACFGSCPTFYTWNGSDFILQAEGFSSSISPALEENDVDAIKEFHPLSSNIQIQLRNEAYETHVIRSVSLLAVPKNDGKVFTTPNGKFLQTGILYDPSSAIGPEGNCSEKLCAYDGSERFSKTDSFDLAEKEIIDLNFKDIPNSDYGLVLSSRQTLLTTFLFYQGLAYMGSKAVDWLANLERNPLLVKKIIDRPRTVLGKIEILLQNENGDWQLIDEIGESGPIASDVKIVPLNNITRIAEKENYSEIKIRLRMTKGLWRIDHIKLAEIVQEVEPIKILPSGSSPENIFRSNVTNLLKNPDSVLVTFPGDKYFINFELPDNYTEYDLFIESQGYYLEWMREEWLHEENSQKVKQMFFNPKKYFKEMASEFKKIENEMEEQFWSSKYVYP